MTLTQSLIDQMQATDHGNSELSEAMAPFLGWERKVWWTAKNGDERVELTFTTDLNAILAEIERVFPDDDVKLWFSKKSKIVTIMRPAIDFSGMHKTSRPLAACIALLRAIEARDNGVGR